MTDDDLNAHIRRHAEPGDGLDFARGCIYLLVPIVGAGVLVILRLATGGPQ